MKGYYVVILLPFIFGCSESKHEKQNIIIDSLRSEVGVLKNGKDSLRQVLQNSSNGWFNPAYDGAKLLKEGIENQEEYIKEALRNRPELIPLEPVLGGTMRFVKIDVLSEKWVIAQYEDGHVMGKALYAYELQKDGTIKFKLIDTAGQ